jgi:hypothetical protein
MNITASTLLICDETLEYPVSLQKIRQNRNVSFAAEPDQTLIEYLGYSIVHPVALPVAPGNVITEAAPALVDGVWTQVWTQTPIDLEFARSQQSYLLNSACAAAITSGFTSSALGSPHQYPSQMTDQQNLTTRVMASLTPGLDPGWTTSFWCADPDGKWTWTTHTAAQIQQVGMDGASAVKSHQDRNAQLQAQLLAATNVAEVTAVVWAP